MWRGGVSVFALARSGSPTAAPSPSPGGRSVAYIPPATGELAALKLVGGEAQVVGRPRGGTPAWDPNGQLIAFESVPNTGVASEAVVPLQAVSVRSPDGFIDKTFGRIGEVRSQPRFLDPDTV